MKKIIIFTLIAVLMSLFCVTAFAEGAQTSGTAAETEISDNSTTEKENASEGEISADKTIPETNGAEPSEEKTAADYIVEYVTSHVEELTVIISLIGAAIYSKIKDGKFGATLGTLNSNAIKIANKSAEVAEAAADKMSGAMDKLKLLEDKFSLIMEKYEKSEEEKAELAAMLANTETLLKSVKVAALEASNEVAELLVHANLPNSVKDEMYGRHMKAVHELEAVEGETNNDGQKA